MIGIGQATYTFLIRAEDISFGGRAPTFPPLPIDIAGRWFGAFQVKFAPLNPNDTYPQLTAANNLGGRIVADFRVGGTIVFTSQIWGKRQYRPVQLRWNGTAWDTAQGWNVVTPTGAFNGSQTYQNAYFLNSTFPAQNYVAGTTPRTHNSVMAVHPEPIYVWFDRDDSQAIDIQLRLFGDKPNSGISNPINDDAPPTGLGVRPAEETIAMGPLGQFGDGRFFVDAWFMRIGQQGLETVADLPTGPTIGNPS